VKLRRAPEKLGLETIPKLFLFKIFARNAHFDHVFIGCRRCSSFQDHLHCNLDCTALNLHLYPARFKMATFYPIAQKFLQFNEILSFSKQNMFSFASVSFHKKLSRLDSNFTTAWQK
jgi:hypothetical protein